MGPDERRFVGDVNCVPSDSADCGRESRDGERSGCGASISMSTLSVFVGANRVEGCGPTLSFVNSLGEEVGCDGSRNRSDEPDDVGISTCGYDEGTTSFRKNDAAFGRGGRFCW